MKKLLIFLLLILSPSLQAWNFFFTSSEKEPLLGNKKQLTIMINPAGDAQNPGRVIDDMFERSLTMRFAEALKKRLEGQLSNVRVVLSRFTGETVEPLQQISFANRLDVDLYISINFYQEKRSRPQVYIYTLLYDPATDFVGKKGTDLTLLAYDQAYKLSLEKTKKCAELMYTTCQAGSRKIAGQCHSFALPFKPLIGIIAPALGIELGITKKHQWKPLVTLVAQGIEAMVKA